MHNAVLVIDLARSLFATIDKAIYSLIAAIYSIILEISGISFFSSEDISAVSKRIYVFIGVFMLFKVTFSLISYLVNPDNISDKNNGLGNVAKNVIVTLFLIIIVPYAFDLLYSAQNAILEDNLIPRVILGTKGEGNNSGTQKVVIDQKICSLDGDYATVEDDGQLLSLLTFRSFFQVYDDTKESIDDSVKKEYCTSNSVSALLDSNIYNDETSVLNTGQYTIDYQFLLSTVTGVVVFLLLLNFAFDIAARTIKLGFLEIIAPMPILSYIDPKSSKDGTFKKWLSEVGKTWASLFIRLAIVYFAIYAIKLVADSFDSTLSSNGIWITLFLIIGILIFAKNAIPLIENIFGIKFDHTVQLNPFKKISEQAAGGKQLLGAGMAVGVGALASAGAVGANLTNNYKHMKEDIASGKLTKKEAKEKYMGLKQTATGVGSGLLYGAYNGVKVGYGAGSNGKYNLGKETLNAIQKSSEDRNLNETLVQQGVSKAPFAKARFKAKDKFTDVIGYQGKSGTTDELKEKIKALNASKADAENRYVSAQESLSRYQANASDKFRSAINSYEPFKRVVEMENGHQKLNDDGGLVWKDVETYDQFANSHQEFINDLNEDEKSKFKLEYESMYKAEQEYREAYNEVLKIQKSETKLTKNKEKMEAAKNATKEK